MRGPSEPRLKITVDNERKVQSVPNPHDVIGQFFRLISRLTYQRPLVSGTSSTTKTRFGFKNFLAFSKIDTSERVTVLFFTGKISTIVVILEGG